MDDPHCIAAIAVTAGTLIASSVAKVIAPASRSYSAEYEKRAKLIVNQGVQYAQMAHQDTDPVFAMHHTTMALAYLQAASHLADDKALMRVSNVDVHALSEKLKKKLASLIDAMNTSSGLRKTNKASAPQ